MAEFNKMRLADAIYEALSAPIPKDDPAMQEALDNIRVTADSLADAIALDPADLVTKNQSLIKELTTRIEELESKDAEFQDFLGGLEGQVQSLETKVG